MKDRWKRGKIIGGWEQERKEYMEEMGVELGKIEGLKYEELEEIERQKQKRKRMEKISESKFNKWYKEI